MKKNILRCVAYLAAAAIAAGLMAPAAWADPDNKEKREVHRLQLQLAASEKKQAELAGQVEELKKKSGELESKNAAHEKKSGSQRKQLAELTDKYQELEKKLQDMTQLNSETTKTLQLTQSEKTHYAGETQACMKKNADLYQISLELMDKYRSKGVVDALLQAEPFTQLEKVRVNNLLQEYRDKSDADKIPPAARQAPGDRKQDSPKVQQPGSDSTPQQSMEAVAQSSGQIAAQSGVQAAQQSSVQDTHQP